MNVQFEGIEINCISGCVPGNVVKNNLFHNLLSPKELKSFEKTVGIKERRWAEKGVTASDLGLKAATEMLKDQAIEKNKIECLIFLSQTPDYKIPFTSNILQHKLSLKKEMLCLDINAGCTGFIQGLATCFSVAKTLPIGGKVILVIAETLSKTLSYKDRGTTMLFGD